MVLIKRAKNPQNKNFKTGVLLFGLILTLAIALGLTSIALSKETETLSKEILIEEFTDLNMGSGEEPVQATSLDKLKPSSLNKESFEWKSQIFKTDFAFDGLGAEWRKDEMSEIKIEAKFSSDGKEWGDWQEMLVNDADEGMENSESAKNPAYEVSDPTFYAEAEYFQYKVTFEEQLDNAFLENIKFTYIRPPHDNPIKKTFLDLFRTKKASAVNPPGIISRAQWGANPAYMSWGPEYRNINKTIIHHTASGNNPPVPAAVVRSIYYYHAVSLGWGDIGYNFLLDQYGNIYEGRYGGNKVVGAHAYGQNYGSIGISAIGNFQYTGITSGTFNAMTNLIAFKHYQNDVNINWGTVFGHRDFCNNPAPGRNCTACPGAHLYARKGQIIDTSRAKVSTYLKEDRDFLNNNNNVLVKSYSSNTVYLWVSGKKRPVTDWKSLTILGYSGKTVHHISGLALSERPTGAKISAFWKKSTSSTVYLVKNNPEMKYPIPSASTFYHFGFNFNNVLVKSEDQINSVPIGKTLKRVIKKPDNSTIYLVTSGKKAPFADNSILEFWGYKLSDVVTLPKEFINTYPTTAPISNLIKGSSPTVYLLKDGKKHPISSADQFSDFKFSWNSITKISQERLNSIPTGSPLSRFIKGEGATIYLIDNKRKHPFPNIETYNIWGAPTFFEFKDSFVKKFSSSYTVNDLVKARGRATVYWLEGGKKYPFPSASTFEAWGKDWNKIKEFSGNIIGPYLSKGSTLTRFIRISNDPTVYYVLKAKKRPLPNTLTLALWGGQLSRVSQIPQSFFDSLPQATTLSHLIKGSPSQVYLVDGGRKDKISSSVFSAWSFSTNDIVTLGDSEISSIPSGPTLGVLIRARGKSTVYKVQNGKSHPFPSAEVFLRWGYKFSQVVVVHPKVLELLEPGTTFSIFARVSESSPTVYLLNGSHKKSFPDSATFEAWGTFPQVTVSPDIKNIPTQGNVTRFAKGSGATVYFMNGGKKRPFNLSTFNAFGAPWNKITSVTDDIIKFLPTGPIMTRLIKKESSNTIYYMSGGKKRPIPDVAVFNSYGFNWNHVRTIDTSYVNNVPAGPILLPNRNKARIAASGSYRVITKSGVVLATFSNTEKAQTTYLAGKYYTLGGNSNRLQKITNQPIRFEPLSGSTIMTIESYYDPNWNGSANYNRFRGSVEIVFSPTSGVTWVVNDLPLNDYVAGLAETNNSGDPGYFEYLKAMSVAARSYAGWHRSRGGKHSGEPFHLKNSRRGNGNDQVYAGYGYEVLAHNYANAARATGDRVVNYRGSVAMCAYSSGHAPRTLSAYEAWGTTAFPWLQSRLDPYGDPNRPCGTGGNHCVGLSGSGARGFSKFEGRSYSWILGHYYTNTYIGSYPNHHIRIAIYHL